jgi:hypothetical protein
MVTKWMEISSEIFIKTFNKFWNNEKNNKVMEIQNIQAISENNPDVRMFIGPSSKIKIEDYPYWNKSAMVISNVLDKLRTEKQSSKISMCMLEEGGPRIIPFGAADTHYELILNSFFGETTRTNLKVMNFWYYKKDNKLFFTYNQKPENDKTERYFRVRIFDFEDWEKEVEYYIEQGKFDDNFMKDDITQDDIVITSSPNKI